MKVDKAQLGRFLVVCATNAILSFLVFGLLVTFTGSIGENDYVRILFQVIAFAVATFNSFVWTKLWVFKNEKMEDDVLDFEMQSFAAITLASIIVRFGVSYFASLIFPPLLHGILTARWIQNIASLTGTVTAIAWNYTGYKFFVFRDKPLRAPSLNHYVSFRRHSRV